MNGLKLIRTICNYSQAKGKKSEYKDYAEFKNMSLTELIMNLIEADMKENKDDYYNFKNPF